MYFLRGFQFFFRPRVTTGLLSTVSYIILKTNYFNGDFSKKVTRAFLLQESLLKETLYT